MAFDIYWCRAFVLIQKLNCSLPWVSRLCVRKTDMDFLLVGISASCLEFDWWAKGLKLWFHRFYVVSLQFLFASCFCLPQPIGQMLSRTIFFVFWVLSRTRLWYAVCRLSLTQLQNINIIWYSVEFNVFAILLLWLSVKAIQQSLFVDVRSWFWVVVS